MPFSVKDDDPFIIFQALQEIARKKQGDRGMIDLSRGDPGYGFTPSINGRMFASYLLLLDSVLNASPEDRFQQYGEDDAKVIMERIRSVTQNAYTETTGADLQTLLSTFIRHAIRTAKEEGKEWNEYTVLRELFAHSAMSGGSYLKPQGQELTRVIIAGWHRRELGVNIESGDLILTRGASHAIGALFKTLGSEGCGYLKEGDVLCIASPVYSPYNSIIDERKLKPLTLSIHPQTGVVAEKDIENLRKATNAVKVLFLIDPNNPTGFSLAESDIEKLADIARDRDLLVITDEVYSSFFPTKKTMLYFCPERTIAINARSKIERSTGLRFGEIIILREGRRNIAAMLGLRDGDDLFRALNFAKSPGRTGGQFQHTTFVTGPAQLLGMAHIVLGGEEREAYKEGLRKNMEIFCSELRLPHTGNLYYIIFDLDALPGCRTASLSIEERLIALAEAGVVYIPAYRFFSECDREHPGALTSVRASVVNTTPERIRIAAQRTKEVLC
jgi:aspartate/methionine/tyrosine aminotransferase